MASLARLIPQCTGKFVEIVVVDGHSTDSTPTRLFELAQQHPHIIRASSEPVNSGIDVDLDKAVVMAQGEYAWLVSDDDILAPDAVDKVMLALQEAQPDVLLVNAGVYNHDFSKILRPQFLEIDANRRYSGAKDFSRFFEDCSNYLTYMGAVCIRRSLWMSRDRQTYFGSWFVHVGVLFQQASGVGEVFCISEPLIKIRHGGGSWKFKAFEIWMSKWPTLIWSFPLPSASKAKIIEPNPAINPRQIIAQAALGNLIPESKAFIFQHTRHLHRVLLTHAILAIPPGILNFLSLVYALARHQNSDNNVLIYDLLASPHGFCKKQLCALFRSSLSPSDC